MITKLTKELSEALQASGQHALEVIDPQTNRTYLIVDSEMHRRAMEALRQQEDLAAIAEGISQMEAGQGRPLDEAFTQMRAQLGFPERK